MGYKLFREVKDHAPDDLKPTELCLLLIIADDANDQTRLSYATRDQLVHWMRMDEWDSVKRVLQRLARRKPPLELRVPIGKDKTGRPIFARIGRKSTYRVPKFAKRGNSDPPSGADGHSKRGDGYPKRGDDYPEEGGQPSQPAGQSSPPSPHPSWSPQESPHSRAQARGHNDAPKKKIIDVAEKTIFLATGQKITREWAARVACHLIERFGDSKPPTYYGKVIENDVQSFLPTPQPPRWPPSDDPWAEADEYRAVHDLLVDHGNVYPDDVPDVIAAIRRQRPNIGNLLAFLQSIPEFGLPAFILDIQLSHEYEEENDQ